MASGVRRLKMNKMAKVKMPKMPAMPKEPKLGTGVRFKKLTNELSTKKGVTDPAGLAAFIGRKKFGKKKFQQLAKAGK